MPFKCLVQDIECTASVAYTMGACYFGDIDQDRGDRDVIDCDVVWGRLRREGV